MKKISLITLHRVTNFGSLLQTYATQTVLENMGFEVEVVDYVPEGLSFKRALWPKGCTAWKQIIKIPLLLVCNLMEYRITDNFLNRYIHMTKKYTTYRDLISDIPCADIYMSGSDQLWNIQNNNPPEDNFAYYLEFAPLGRKRIAYAGSFGRTELDADEISEMSIRMKKYNSISVREDTALSILNILDIKNGIQVLDPTFLLNRKEWLDFSSGYSFKEQSYIFVYNLNRNNLIEELSTELSHILRIPIINFADTFEFIRGAKNRIGNTPIDLINYIAFAECVVTDSFHGTALSINFNTKFICVAAPKFNTRIESILRSFGLSDRMVDSVQAGVNMYRTDIDWLTVNDILARERIISLKFLEESLYGE